MGERTYRIAVWNSRDQLAVFSESQDDWGCLCTFPHNDQGALGPERIRSLALLGAAVALAAYNPDELNTTVNAHYLILPDAVPQWIRDELMRILPPSDEEEWA
jgi:hypothetical protein